MTAIIEQRTPQLIAAEIRSIDAHTRQIVLRSAIDIGNKLIEAKELVAHGEWGAWLEENVNYSQSTANNFMRVAEEYGSNFQALENLNYSQAVALLAVPAEEREQFAADVDAESLSTRELQAAVKARKEAEKRAKEAEKTAEDERKAKELATSHLQDLQKKAEGYYQDLSRLKVELADAKIAGNAEEAEKLKQELAEAQARATQLEKELKAKPIDVSAVVEKVPDHIEAELAELRKKVAQPTDAAGIAFKLRFEAWAAGSRDLLSALDQVKSTDPEAHAKFSGAVRGLVGKILEGLG